MRKHLNWITLLTGHPAGRLLLLWAASLTREVNGFIETDAT